MKKTLSSFIALSIALLFGAATLSVNAADAPAKTEAKKETKMEVCKDKEGKEVKCPEKKKGKKKKVETKVETK